MLPALCQPGGVVTAAIALMHRQSITPQLAIYQLTWGSIVASDTSCQYSFFICVISDIVCDQFQLHYVA